ncbi:amino acid ABC transporter substrate-binding protein [Actinosynnema pretiosum subsp. pretiosum]|uniref:Extracellular solute-binding protein family 3 n=2 Tax=Actinosynnema TaxID=40566 RepID=C6WFP0_ACTMD|nr:amino acid ABC transporter substrate-binding protein [Actinosynnema mirum]ACU35975.1 extracellular solute-binding protein family 3 [Actinosynnema mirum DSM 43827]AXX29429.1 Lysine-arginine-ornithine-binding periplasmic protein [Actinosynnema pretiosum subsp. pretiosum]QUF06326.1 amino acid ABC transporter substrate-binding protein [Actinosynnema pretiosum subsp. pretiosum]
MTTSASLSPTVSAIRRRGHLRLGVSTGIRGLSWTDDAGVRRGLDVDTGRAVAAALFGEPGRIEYTEIDPEDRIRAVTSDAVDLLACNATWTFSRECDANVAFVLTTCYDEGAILVRRDSGIASADDLDGHTLGMCEGTSSEEALRAWFGPRGRAVHCKHYASPAAALAAYASGEVTGYVADGVVVAGERTRLATPSDHVVLPERVSVEPMGPVVKDDDPQWVKTARWVFFALIAAEAAGVTSHQVRAGTAEDPPLLKDQSRLAAKAGLHPRWISAVVGEVGNYGEIYERNLGDASGLRIPRGYNELWLRGGLMYAPPLA